MKKVLERLTVNAKLATAVGPIQHTLAQWNMREQQMKNKKVQTKMAIKNRIKVNPGKFSEMLRKWKRIF